MQSALNHQLGRADFEDLVHKGASMLRGRSLSDLDQIGERLFVQKVVSRIYPEMRELVCAHMERGHTVVPSSSALTIQVQPVARFLGIKNILSNRFETDDDGLLTGKVLKPILWGPRKGKRRPKIRVRTRNRPFQELVLRRRRRRHRACRSPSMPWSAALAPRVCTPWCPRRHFTGHRLVAVPRGDGLRDKF